MRRDTGSSIVALQDQRTHLKACIGLASQKEDGSNSMQERDQGRKRESRQGGWGNWKWKPFFGLSNFGRGIQRPQRDVSEKEQPWQERQKRANQGMTGKDAVYIFYGFFVLREGEMHTRGTKRKALTS